MLRNAKSLAFGEIKNTVQGCFNRHVPTSLPYAVFDTAIVGAATKASLIKFQNVNGIEPAIGYFGPITRTYIGSH
jgi:hypothetical protein